MEHIGYENNCTCSPCLKKYNRWLALDIQDDCGQIMAILKRTNKTLNSPSDEQLKEIELLNNEIKNL